MIKYNDLDDLKELLITKTYELNELEQTRTPIDLAYRSYLSDVIERYRCNKNIDYLENVKLTLEAENKKAKQLRVELNKIDSEMAIIRNDLKAINTCVMLECSKNKMML